MASSSGPTEKYKIEILYKYSVNGIDYKNDKFYSMELVGKEVAMSEPEASKILSKLSDETMIFYNPENSKESFVIQNNLITW